MTEQRFWEFLKKMQEGGRVAQLSGAIDTDENDTKEASAFISGHSVLPVGYDKIPKSTIGEIGALLNNKKTLLAAKEAMLILLAHHPSKQALSALKEYNSSPDQKLKIFAELALDECACWNE